MSETETTPPAQDSTDAALIETVQPATTSAEEVKAEATPGPTEEVPAENKDEAKPFELKLPEGSLLTPAHLEKISTFAKEKGLSDADAQALLERESAVVSDFQSEQVKQYEETKEKWIGDVKADKELGGRDFEKNIASAKKAVDRFATPEFKKALDSTGFGNHPELVRVFARIGKAMASDQVIRGSEIPAQKSVEELLYGGSKK